MLGAFRAAHHGRPYIEHCRLCIKPPWMSGHFSSRELDILLQYRFAYSASETIHLKCLFRYFFIPGARHVSRRGNSTGTKPQRSTALAGIWQLSFGAIRKANANCISGLGRSRYLKSRRAFLGKFSVGRRFCPVCEISSMLNAPPISGAPN